MRSESLTKDLDILPEFHKQKTFAERRQICCNSCIGFFYLLCCIPCYFCYLNDKCYDKGNNEFIHSQL